MPVGVQPAPAMPSYLMSAPALSPSLPGTANTNANPFILKFKTKQIKVCQACRKKYEGTNDTMGLVVARMEWRMVSNLITGAQFLGKESNSHYHAHELSQAGKSFVQRKWSGGSRRCSLHPFPYYVPAGSTLKTIPMTFWHDFIYLMSCYTDHFWLLLS